MPIIINNSRIKTVTPATVTMIGVTAADPLSVIDEGIDVVVGCPVVV